MHLFDMISGDETPKKDAPANRRPAKPSDGSDNLSATLAADRVFPVAVAELAFRLHRTSHGQAHHSRI
jgi:hypothetical protein